MTVTAEEKLPFQAEVSRLLDIVANALYSNREVFLRELISNASDACDRLRYAAITQPDLTGDDPTFRITLAVDRDKRRLEIADNGIGMNREELVEHLGTIARSGTAAFIEQLGDRQKDVDLIGQFGVGFYSAFMVAEAVTVETRRAGESQGWRWHSDGAGSFTIAACEEAPSRGTRIILHLKDDAGEFLETATLRRVVKTYSDHIAVPVQLLGEGEPETLNAASALWMRPKSEITEQQYKEFYHHVAHAFDDPWHRIHFRVEGVMEYSGLLYIPSRRPFDLYDPQRKTCVKLYVKRVFITEDCETLIPAYLRFLRGVVDSEDLPLNISRETLQHNPKIARMKAAITKRVLGELENRAKEDLEGYARFWETFGPVLKEGLYEDPERRETLLGLSLFRSTKTEGWTSLADYVERMRPGQEAIYIISGDEVETLKRSPQIEGFSAKGVEVLLLTDPIDEFWVPAVGTYQDKPLRSVTQIDGSELDSIEGEGQPDEAGAEAADEGELATVIAFLKSELGEAVKDVRPSRRLTSSPVCLVAENGDMDMHLARLLRQHGRLDSEQQRILEINARHALIRNLAARLKAGGDGDRGKLGAVAQLLLDQARILEGEAPRDPSAFSRRLTDLVERGLA